MVRLKSRNLEPKRRKMYNRAVKTGTGTRPAPKNGAGKTERSLTMKKRLLCMISLVLVLVTLLPGVPRGAAAGEVLAFPEADGLGKYTVGGRGGRVIEVTNLLDGPVIPGSLRAAVEASGPRIVVFKVAGTIDLVSPLDIWNPYITIAGQTAPGEGITLRNYTFYIKVGEVIIRNIRFRLGDLKEADAVDIRGRTPQQNVILDHCSLSWGVDETLCIRDFTNLTVQWCFITEGLHDNIHHAGKHSKGALVSGSRGQRVSFHHNLFAHNDARNPRPQGLLPPDEDTVGFYFDFTNNVVYDWGRSYAAKNLDVSERCTMNFINNYFIAGPSSKASNFMVDKNINSRMYFSGNYMNGKMPADQYSKIIYEDFKKPDNGWKLSEPFDNMTDRIQPAEKAYAMVMKNGGAAVNRDAYDDRIVSEVIKGTGRVIDRPSDVGGWPVLETGEAYLDTDKDGMPDDWESTHGLNPADPADGSLDRDGDGYTNVEEFLNSLMADLYTEDAPFPQFDQSFRFFRYIGYSVLRLYWDARKWVRTMFGRAV